MLSVIDAVVRTVSARASADFVRGQVAALPFYARAGVRVLAAVFAAHAWVWRRRAFAVQSAEERAALVAQWRGAPVGLCRNFILLCEGLAWFSHYAHGGGGGDAGDDTGGGESDARVDADKSEK